MAPLLSVRLSWRVKIIEKENKSELPSPINPPTLNTSPPGLRITSTPRKPTPIAAQRRAPTRSPSIGTPSAVMNKGAAKVIA